MNIGHVQGGTNAGNRRTKEQGPAWICLCGRQNERYNSNCPACYRARP